MVAFRFKHVRIESFGLNLPDQIVSSAEIEDRIAPLYKNLSIPFGTLERISGVKNRRVWSRDMMPSVAGTEAVKRALEGTGFDESHIGALISCSVCRDLFEPSTANLMQNRLGWREDIISFDVTNACIGFSNGLMLLGNMIESGIVKAGVVVSAENPAIITESNFRLMEERAESMTRDELLKMLPTFTVGAGAVAYVLCHENLSPHGHKFMGGVAKSAVDHVDLCTGNGDFCMRQPEIRPLMETESSKLIAAAAELGGRTWEQASELLGWSKEDVDHSFCHQVGRQVNDTFYRVMGLDFKKDFAIWRDYGNLISAALPTSLVLGSEEKKIKSGEKVLLTAFGSGLNSMFLGIEW